MLLYYRSQHSTTDFDDLILSRHDNDRLAWNQKLSLVGPAVCQLASKFRDGRLCYVVDLKCGSFNFCIKVQFEDDGAEWMLRFPIPGKVMFPEQKVRAEVATTRFIAEKTDIPLPTVIAYGMADDNPTGLGPFIITTFIKGTLVSGICQDCMDHNVSPQMIDSCQFCGVILV